MRLCVFSHERCSNRELFELSNIGEHGFGGHYEQNILII